ncbi:MAG: hypothetical protein WCB99_10815, partial [Candidatus Cybelea sp.]
MFRRPLGHLGCFSPGRPWRTFAAGCDRSQSVGAYGPAPTKRPRVLQFGDNWTVSSDPARAKTGHEAGVVIGYSDASTLRDAG